MKRSFYFLLVVTLLIPCFAIAASQGKIKGKIVDSETGEALVGAAVVVIGTPFGATTDANGEYTILKLQVGTYSIRASYVGYQSITIENVRVNADLTSEANFKLPPEGVQVSTVVIVAERPLVNKSATSVVRIVDNDFVANLPVRGVENAVRLQPGVVSRNNNFYLRGARADATGYVVDGVPATNKLFGGRGISFSAETVEQIQVQAGGYAAEYGNASGGLILSQLKTGPEKLKVTLMLETDNYTGQGKKSLGGYSYGYSDYLLTVGGPITTDKIRFFGSFQNTFFRDPDIRKWDGIDFKGVITDPAVSAKHPDNTYPDTLDLYYPSGNRIGGGLERFNYVGTLLYNLGDMQLKASGSYYTETERSTTTMENIFNSARNPLTERSNGFGTIKLTHFITPTINYEASAFYTIRRLESMDPLLKSNFNAYGDSLENAKFGFVYGPSRYSAFNDWTIFGGDITFNQPGAIQFVNLYDLQKEEKLGGRVDIVAQMHEHLIKFGGEINRYVIRRFNPGNVTLRAQVINSSLPDDQKAITLRTQGAGIDNYGYDVYGREIEEDLKKGGGVTDLGPRRPVEAAFYIQDKIELSDINMHVGVRYDYINNGGIELINPASLVFDDVNKVIARSSWRYTKAAQYVSPRIGFSFPITDKTVFHAQFNKLVSSSRFRDMYLGLGRTYSHLKGGNFFTQVSGYGLRPERTTQYEIGFQQQLSDFASLDITTFYRDIQDQIQYTQIAPAPGASQQLYPTFVNGDYSTTKGLELRVTLRRVNRVQAQLNYTYSDARGTGSSATTLAGAVAASGQPGFIPKFVFPVDFNQEHNGSASVDYRFAKNDGGTILEQAGVNLLLAFNSGYSFTKLVVTTLSLTDPRSRIPIEPIGSSTTPWQFRLDLRLDKTVELGLLSANFYIYIQNLLNLDNPTAVFARTGDPKNDGWLSTDLGVAQVATYGQQYVNLYNAVYGGNNANVNSDPSGLPMLSSPRQIRFGVKLEY